MKQKKVEVALIFSDPLYLECMRLAMQSKGRDTRIGSILVKNGKIIGRGENRAIAHRSFGRLERPIRQGYANHAEIEAFCDAITRGNDSEGADLFAAGYFPGLNGLLILKKKFDFICDRCPPIIMRFPIATVNLPAPQGWLSKWKDEAFTGAAGYVSKAKGQTLERRVESVRGRLTIADLLGSVGQI